MKEGYTFGPGHMAKTKMAAMTINRKPLNIVYSRNTGLIALILGM